jgi:hypothetical protein
MEQPQLYIDLSGLIEYKINNRNQLAKKTPRPDGLIKILDREIDILEKIECYIPALEQQHAKSIISTTQKAFQDGILSGKMEAKTGRPHPRYIIHPT